jgi:hypothetical protein
MRRCLVDGRSRTKMVRVVDVGALSQGLMRPLSGHAKKWRITSRTRISSSSQPHTHSLSILTTPDVAAMLPRRCGLQQGSNHHLYPNRTRDLECSRSICLDSALHCTLNTKIFIIRARVQRHAQKELDYDALGKLLEGE